MKKCNSCDGIYNSIDIHFTSVCDNKCKHCIDAMYEGKKIIRPNPLAIANSVLANSDGLNDILFLGGEPCLYLEELLECISIIKSHRPLLKVYVTTAVPYTCFQNKDLFHRLIKIVDGINLSVQHSNQKVADSIRCTESLYDRNEFYNSLPYKEKIRINLNLVKPHLYQKQDIIECLNVFDKMGFGCIRLAELQRAGKYYVSFEEIFNIKLRSPYSNGCQTEFDMDKIIKGFKTPLILKRSCFLCENSRKANLLDGIKVTLKLLSKSKNGNFNVIYEDGTIERGWI